MVVLGIETSCDETAIAIVDNNKNILAHTLLSQIDVHQKFGGVVPELASRNHLDAISHIYQNAIETGKINPSSLSAIAVTAGPGLIGGLLVGVMFAKGLAMALNKPIIAVNHLEAHALTVRLCCDLEFPYLMLLVSGGHCQILEVLGVGNYILIGQTRDDSIGEAFDKVAKTLGLPYPGGPIIEKLAREGDENSVKFPIPILHESPYDFSFSGLKTAVKRYADSITLNDKNISDICASFQKVVAKVLCNRISNAAAKFQEKYPMSLNIVIAGGVAANQYIKNKVIDELPHFNVLTPPINLCTDNGVMIAWAGIEKLNVKVKDDLMFEPKSRWPLSSLNADK